ncbi:hypothetical protein [Candidatus Sulfurimonas baltica]|uniref:Uncharacterized protein n=1 Tax=Candidatus Sulfurimonas baltica TaxID=2740404 RepID=A0A7S7RNH5_9BACT|nr:hypothetical protein [Candidatus Sulfurimonas baltica]QOY52559.1 hypothetical protein HUE88_02385 [Candidatus Sulfurimonas baltica]
MHFYLGDSQSFSDRNSFVDLFAKEGDTIVEKVQLPSEAFMSVLKMD